MAGFPPVRPNADGCRVCFRRRCRRVTCGRWTRTPVSQSSTETLRSCIQSPVSQLLHNTEPVNINPVSAALWHHEHRSHATCWPLDSLTHTSLLTTWKLIFREHLKKKKTMLSVSSLYHSKQCLKSTSCVYLLLHDESLAVFHICKSSASAKWTNNHFKCVSLCVSALSKQERTRVSLEDVSRYEDLSAALLLVSQTHHHNV